MKSVVFLFLIMSVLLNVGCSSQFGRNKDEANIATWSSLTIRSEGGVLIRLNNLDDTSTVIAGPIFNFFAPPAKTPPKIDTIKVYFTIAEKDTIFRLVKDLILNPAKTSRFCTEYVGHLQLYLDYGQFRQSGEYSSVCDWTKLSEKTAQLYNILKRRIKGVYLGEGE